MSRNTACTVFVGNLDEKVTERVLYEILIQAGYIVDLHIPRDKESQNHKGYAFAEYETEEVANYAVRLFSGLVRLHNKTLRFAMSGQDKAPHNSASSSAKKASPSPTLKPHPTGEMAGRNYYSEGSMTSTSTRKDSVDKQITYSSHHYSSSMYSAARGVGDGSFEYSRRVIGSVLGGAVRNGGGNPLAYPSY